METNDLAPNLEATETTVSAEDKELNNDEPILNLDGGGEKPQEKENEDEPILKVEEDETKEENENVGVPEDGYGDFELPENFTLDDESKQEMNGIFKELNLSQKGGQKLIDLYTERVLKMKELELEQLATQRKAWRSELRNRPNYATERALALKGMNAVVKSEGGKAFFKDSWASDHPELFDIFVNVGKLLGEDSSIGGSTGGGQTDSNLLRFPVK
jgi:hypothetical protein